MRTNIGIIDRAIRLFICLIMIGATLLFNELMGILGTIIMGPFLLYLIITGLLGWDPFYAIMGIDTDM